MKLLGLVVSNIIENAVVHSNKGGIVQIETTADGEVVSIRVANSGSTVPDNQAEMVFECFWRSDAARTAAGVHCGLGL